MRLLLSTLLAFVLAGNMSFANHTTPNGKYTKEKTIKREFTVSKNALLEIKNSYGNLNITSWNEDRTVIEVYIKTSGNNEKKVTEKLDEITVNFSANNDYVKAVTQFSNDKWNWGWNNSNVNVEVNYTIKVPITNKVDLSNDYGAIYLNKLNNTAKISCDYGKLDIGELWGDNNELNFDYTQNSRIGILKNGKINADYSGFVVEKTKNLVLNADYTSSKIEQSDNVQYNCDYGSLTLGDVMNFNGNGDYLTLKIDNVFGNVDIRSDYGSISIGELTSKAGNVNITADYTGIKIGYSAAYSFSFDIDLDYAGFSGKDGLNITYEKSDYSEHHYKGYNNTTSGKSVFIKSEYGGVTFTRK